MTFLSLVLVIIYLLALFLSFVYGINSYFLILYYGRRRDKELKQNRKVIETFWEGKEEVGLPAVTIQLPIYNEKYVVERLLEAVALLDYPKEKLQFQVLDDSTDETTEIARRAAKSLEARGFAIQFIHRDNREGFKAGALREGLSRASGEFIAIFDADFVPPPRFLKETIPFFQDPGVAMVQGRWGHLNHDFSLITRAQALGIDGHFGVEQAARAWSGFFMNFNGSGGIWRAQAIADSGGWRADTLTEDLDLSYRAMLKGWRMKYLPELECPAEVPILINAFKNQQHRWAKGSIQTAMKNLPRIIRARLPLMVKYQAAIHLTHYLVHPLMLVVALFSLPMLLLNYLFASYQRLFSVAILFALATFGPSSLYLFSQRILHRDWMRRARFMPLLLFMGTGIAINNTRGVLEAIFKVKGEFTRTPKYKVSGRRGDWEDKSYRPARNLSAYLELLMGAYCMTAISLFLSRGSYVLSPFLVVFAIGFTWVGMASLYQSSEALRVAAARVTAFAALHWQAGTLLILALALRLARAQNIDPFEDSYYHWFLSARLAMGEGLGSVFRAGTELPLYHMVGALILKGWGMWNLAALKYLGIAASLIIMVLTYRLAPGKRAGVLAVAFMAVNPIEVLTSSMAVPAPIMTLFLMLSVYLFVKSGVPVASLLFLALAAVTSKEAWAFSLFLFIYFLFAWMRPGWETGRVRLLREPGTSSEAAELCWGRGALASPATGRAFLLAVAIPALIMAWQLSGAQAGAAEQLAASGSFYYYMGGEVVRSLLYVKYILLTGLPLYAGWSLFRRRGARNHLWLFTLVAFALLFFRNSSGLFSGNHRYIYMLLPFMAIFAGSYFATKGGKALALIALMLIATYLYHFNLYRKFEDLNMPLVAAGRHLSTARRQVFSDSPEVTFFSGVPPNEVITSGDLSSGTAEEALSELKARGIRTVVWADRHYLKFTRLFPELKRGKDKPPFRLEMDPSDWRLAYGAKEVYIYNFGTGGF